MSRAAIRYAKAILDLAVAKGVAGDVNNDMLQITASLSESAELQAFVASETINNSVKHKALLEVFDAANPFTKGLFRLLEENKRFEIFGEVASAYTKLFEEYNGTEKVTVTTAVALDSEMESRVMSKVLEFTNKKVSIENVVDPSIIGGFILRVGDKQFNASVAAKLNSLKKELNN